jgi:hypothetical protein
MIDPASRHLCPFPLRESPLILMAAKSKACFATAEYPRWRPTAKRMG